jgi:hypothetical protein
LGRWQVSAANVHQDKHKSSEHCQEVLTGLSTILQPIGDEANDAAIRRFRTSPLVEPSGAFVKATIDGAMRVGREHVKKLWSQFGPVLKEIEGQSRDWPDVLLDLVLPGR